VLLSSRINRSSRTSWQKADAAYNRKRDSQNRVCAQTNGKNALYDIE